MREIRQSGSEGGEGDLPDPYATEADDARKARPFKRLRVRRWPGQARP